MKRFERLDEATTPNGTVLTLCRHDGAFLIRADGAELMSTRHPYSEERLAEIVCDPLREQPGARVLIGGLGLGFTLRAALRSLGADATVVIAEIMEAVIRWNKTPEYGLSVAALADTRVELRHDDVLHVLTTDPGVYDAIMLDVDNGPEAMTTPGNARLYGDPGIRIAVAALRPGGTLAYWCAARDNAFEKSLRRANLHVDVEIARAHVSGGPEHVLYIAHR